MIYVCPECGRTEGPEFGLVPEGEPIFCNRHTPRDTVISHPADGYPRMVSVPVYPASVVQELVGALEEIAAPNVCAYQLGDDDCLSLGAPERCPRCLAIEALANFHTTTGGQDG